MKFYIRPCVDQDMSEVAQIYKQGIKQVALKHYSDDQVAAWSSFADDTDDFRKWINKSATFVALNPELQIVGFAGLEAKGRISSLFVAPEVMRSGVATALLSHLMDEINKRGINSITTDASEFSKPLFKKFGFTVTSLEHTRFKGVLFTRYKMILDR